MQPRFYELWRTMRTKLPCPDVSGRGAFGRSSANTVTANFPSTVPFGYDVNGNMLSDGNLGHNYDDENQPIRVRATNWMPEFVYDGKKRRRISRNEKPGPTTTAVTSVTPSSTTFNGSGCVL